MKAKKGLINLNKLQVALFVLLDIVFSNAAMFLGIYIRYGMMYQIIPIEALNDYGQFILINSVVTVIVFVLFKLYNNLWRYASFGDAVNIVCACTVVVVVDIALCFILGCTYLPRSAYIIMYMLFMILTVANRFADRSFRWVKITSFSTFLI